MRSSEGLIGSSIRHLPILVECFPFGFPVFFPLLFLSFWVLPDPGILTRLLGALSEVFYLLGKGNSLRVVAFPTSHFSIAGAFLGRSWLWEDTCFDGWPL
jgi:hypothetical protein